MPMNENGVNIGLRQSTGQSGGVQSSFSGCVNNALLKVYIADDDGLSFMSAAGGGKRVDVPRDRDSDCPKPVRKCPLKHADSGQGVADVRVIFLLRGQGSDFRTEIYGVDGPADELQMLKERAGEDRVVRHYG